MGGFPDRNFKAFTRRGVNFLKNTKIACFLLISYLKIYKIYQFVGFMSDISTHHNHEHHQSENSIFGFWVYIMSDCILFSALFATFIVLKDSTAGGASLAGLFSLPFVLVETMILLSSSFTFGLALLFARDNKKCMMFKMLAATFLLGISFIAMEFYEFRHLIHEGYTFSTNAAFSSFFTLVGTHGLHVISGLFWMILVITHLAKNGITTKTTTKLYCLGLFWHFLDVIWVCVFTIVYLMNAI
jgi:cytochrome o ubiquinol oxidase subunit III